MKPSSVAFLIAVSSSLLTVSTYADTFDYSYAFGDGTVVSGALDGTLNGNLVTGVTLDSLYFNGALVPGPYYETGNHPIGSGLADQIGDAVVSFDVTLNNFWFLNDFWLNGNPNGIPGNYGVYLVILNNSDAEAAGALWQITPTSLILPPQDRPPLSDSWSLTEVTPVPDGGLTIAMIGMTVAGFACLRRRI